VPCLKLLSTVDDEFQVSEYTPTIVQPIMRATKWVERRRFQSDKMKVLAYKQIVVKGNILYPRILKSSPNRGSSGGPNCRR